MGWHDGVPDVLPDAGARRGGAGRGETDGGADATPPPGHPADRRPDYAGIGLLVVPAALGWSGRGADAHVDGDGVRVRRSGGAARVPRGHRGDATGDDAVRDARGVAGVGVARRARQDLGGAAAAQGAGGDDGVGRDDPAAVRPRGDGGGAISVMWRDICDIEDDSLVSPFLALSGTRPWREGRA